MASRFGLKLAIVIPIRNQMEYTQQCVKSLRKYTKTDFGIVFVDNGCVDGSIEWIHQYCKHNSIKYAIVDAKDVRVNLSKVWNMGVKRAQTWSPKYIAVINNDVVVHRDWWKKFDHFFEEFDTKADYWMAVPRFTRGEKPVDFEYQAEEATRDHRAAAAPLVGFFMVFRAYMFDPQVVGLFDERFRLWYGDNDMWMRLSDAGHPPLQLYNVLIHHYESKTLKDDANATPIPDKEAVIREDEELFNIKYQHERMGRKKTEGDNRIGVTIAIPNMGQMRTELVQLLLGLQAKESRYAFSFFLASGMAFHDYARNMIVEDFLKRDDQWLIMVDADIIPPPNFIELIEHEVDKKIIGAICHVWTNNQLQATIYNYDPETKLYESRPDAQAFTGLIETPVTGTGCIAIHREVLDAMEAPYFSFEYNPETRARTRGEDIYFCEKASRAGFQVYVDTNVVTNHIKDIGMYGIFKMTTEWTKDVLRRYDKRKNEEAAKGKAPRPYSSLVHVEAPHIDNTVKKYEPKPRIEKGVA